jgi:hypothetical protein
LYMVILFSSDSCDFLFISQFIFLILCSNCLLNRIMRTNLSYILCNDISFGAEKWMKTTITAVAFLLLLYVPCIQSTIRHD